MVAKAFIQKGGDTTAANVDLDTPLLLVGDSSLVQMPVDADANIEPRNQLGLTPLHKAVQGNHFRVIETLLANGANLKARSSSGQTPLLLLDNCHPNTDLVILELLINKGADPDAMNEDGVTLHKLPSHRPLDWVPVASQPHYLDIVELLLNNVSNVNAEDQKGHTPLDYAIGSSSKAWHMAELIEKLREHGGKENKTYIEETSVDEE